MKSRNLEILRDNGFNVPEFEVIKWSDRDKKIDTSKYTGKYAVRSSSYLEDGIYDSFAGQFDTYLNVSPKNINAKVKKCFNSLNNKNIQEYVTNKKIKANKLKMDVIIQKMVKSKYSGVIFTANPNGLLNETVIVAGKGLGNKVVEDKINTTTYYYNMTDKKYYYEGIRDLLSTELIEELIDLSIKIKEIFGEYLDIEYAISDNQIYILQVRPITTLAKNKKKTILDNSNIVESYPNVSLPLTISFVKFVYSKVFEKEALRLSKNKKLVASCKEEFENMVGSSSGRLYYKISNWYTLIKFLPFSRKIIPIWQDMLGVKDKSYDNNKLKIPFFTKIKIYISTFVELKNVTKNMDKLNKKFIDINNYFYDNYNSKLSTKEVIKLYGVIKDDLLVNWDITLVNDLYSFIYTGILKKRLKKKKYSDEKINEYISGINNIESLKPIKSLIELAYKKDKLKRKEYNELFNNYIIQYGDRSLEELKLESDTFRTNPKLLRKKINEYRKDKNKLALTYRNLNKDKEVIKLDFITNFIAKRAMQGIKNREISRLNRSRIYGMVRTMFLHIGKNYVKGKKLSHRDDIFYLTIDEVFNAKKYDLKRIVKERKKEYKKFYQLPNYSRLVFLGEEFDKHPRIVKETKTVLNKNILEGTPTSNGKITGEALVIEDINHNYSVKDKILITKMTDPGWVFLLVNAKGVISEKGSILSHTAIISREINIPSIVGVEKATEIIKTGDYIEMDAYKGTIKILKRGKK